MPDVVELIGYLASALIVVSLLMASVLRLRVVNLVGSLVFTTYGVLIDSPPVVIANAAIVCINVYYLTRLLRDRAGAAYFEVVGVAPRAAFLQRFLAFHHDDILESQPHFAGVGDDHLAWLVLRDATPVGVVLARPAGDVGHLDLDYVTPEHRDFTAGQVLYGESGALREAGFREVTAVGATGLHRRYLARMGFVEHEDRWVRPV
ncbi:YgjV family protein [Egicoccus sp. AB-alg6-2]|uniref:YgjV family protein n=1 Tax=Egicoccus sp. AB-alg6-2 TaxID=3242692 RepID=UPI00359F0CD4